MNKTLEARPEIRQFTVAEAAWLAGVVDGEGSIGLYDYGREGRRVQIQMGNTNKPFVEEMKRIIGGVGSSVCRTTFSTKGRQPHKGRKPMFHYTLKGSLRCYFVLKQIVPYLIIKKEKALSIIRKLESEPFGRWKNTTADARRRASLRAKRLWKDPQVRAARIAGMKRFYATA
jgi:hypothetical protein